MKITTSTKTKKSIRTKDTYEAAFYILFGGKFEKVRKSILNDKKARHKGFKVQWTLSVSDVPTWAIETWRTGNAYGNITEYVDVRNKLKKEIKRGLGSNPISEK